MNLFTFNRVISTFDRMIAPTLIKVLYWLSMLVVMSAGVVSMFMGGASNFLRGALILGVGFIAVRVWCELLIVIFKINDNLQVIRARGDPPAG